MSELAEHYPRVVEAIERVGLRVTLGNREFLVTDGRGQVARVTRVALQQIEDGLAANRRRVKFDFPHVRRFGSYMIGL